METTILFQEAKVYKKSGTLRMTDHYQKELLPIRELLKQAPHGMSVTEIARKLGKNAHSVGRYLDILHASGQVGLRTYGKAKVYSLSSRIPLDSILGFSGDLVIVIDTELRVVRINDQLLRLIGQNRGEVIGKNLSFLPVRDRRAEEIVEQIKISLDSGLPDREFAVSGDGDRYFRQKNIPTVFEDGRTGTTVLLEDITGQKNAERALRESEERFRLMAENVRDGILIRENGRVSYANHRVEEIFGYSRKELSEITPATIVAPEDRERVGKTIEDFTSSRAIPSDLSFWFIRKDGSRRYIYSRVSSLELDRGMIWYVVITDMTDWKLAQEALENQLGLLQHLINTFPNPIFYADTGKRFLGSNAAFIRISGLRSEEIVGRTPGEIFRPDAAEFLGRHDNDLVQDPGKFTYRGTMEYSDRSRHEVTVQKSTFTHVDGSLAGIVAMITADRELPRV